MSRHDTEVVDVRFLRPDVALVSCIKHISDEREPAVRDSKVPLSERGSQTFVLVSERGNWRIALAQTTRSRSEPSLPEGARSLRRRFRTE